MKISKQARRDARELFHLCITNCALDENRVRKAVHRVAEGKPRGYLTDLIKSFIAPHAWCALERDSELTQPYISKVEEE